MQQTDQRLHLATQWVQQQLPTETLEWFSIAGDASARRYFRVQGSQQCFVLMDAPPQQKTTIQHRYRLTSVHQTSRYRTRQAFFQRHHRRQQALPQTHLDNSHTNQLNQQPLRFGMSGFYKNQ